MLERAMKGLTRRRFLGGLAASSASAALALGALPRRAHAIGPGSLFRIAEIGWAGLVPQSAPRSSGLSRLGTELAVRTSIEVGRDNPSFVTLGQEKLFETPFLYLSGDRRFAPPTGRELESLRRHLTFGGFLLIDSAEGRAGGEFDTSVRQLVAELFPAPAAGLVPLPDDHVIYKSFYLLRSVAGRVAAARDLEAVFPGGAGTPGGRAAIVYCQNDLGGAWAKDTFGNFLYQCYPGGEEQREHSFRVGINLAMYALCLDYKTDQVHVPFILKRRRWRTGEP
jgi:Domain of unknown function (DUF4159)